MLKDFIKSLVIAGSVFALAGTASAATIHIVGGGASAQGQFWRTAGTAYLANDLGCSNVVLDGLSGAAQENAIMKGEACTNAGGNDVVISYIEISSSVGCANAPGSQPVTVVDPSTCAWTGNGSCTGTASFGLDVGCADVRCESIDQTTEGYEDGRHGDYGDNENYVENCQNGDCDSSWTTYGTSAGYGWNTGTYPNVQVREGIVVPFAFHVNNAVTKTRCVAPTDETGDEVHMAYSKWGWQCVKGAQACVAGVCEDTGDACTQNTRYELNEDGTMALVSGACPVSANLAAADRSNDCVGYYKCDHGAYYSDTEDSTTTDYTGYSKTGGVCLDGNQGSSPKACTTPQDCKADITTTKCMEQPIDNISRLQALLIFSGQVNNWKSFGPWYPDLPIVQCMRHAGSGTHATLDKAIFRGDRGMITSTAAANSTDANWNFIPDWRECENPALCGTPANTPHVAATGHTGEEATVWHYKSSTDLLYDCVDWYDGGIGYIDADKVLGNDDASRSHTVKLEGVEPTREKVKFGEYIYWSPQMCMFDQDKTDLVPGKTDIIEGLMAFAADPANLSNDAFGTPADWWSTTGEMEVQKTSDTAYPTAK